MDKLPIEVLRMICGYVCDRTNHTSFMYANYLTGTGWWPRRLLFLDSCEPLLSWGCNSVHLWNSECEVLRLYVSPAHWKEIKENPRQKQFLIHARRLNIMAIPDNGYQEVFDLDSLRGSYNIFGPDEDLRARDLIPNTFSSPGFFFNRHLSEPLIQNLRAWREPGYYNEKNWELLI